MICSRCGKNYENTNREILIQENLKTGKLVCANCACEETQSPWPNFCEVCGELATHVHFSTGGCCGRKDCCEKLSKEKTE